MASVAHVMIGMAAGRLLASLEPVGTNLRPARAMFWCAALSMLPDADVLGLALGIPYGAPLGHRGASHSLLFALLVGAIAGRIWMKRARPHAAFVGLLIVALVASHGLLDALTDGGLGVALLWPFTSERFFFPWRPIPVAPIGVRYFSPEGLQCAAFELIAFAPALAYALWPRKAASGQEA
jgi:inner membrane protein